MEAKGGKSRGNEKVDHIPLMAAILVVSVVGLSCRAQEIKGTVSKIEGDNLGVMDEAGKEEIVKVKDPESLRDLEVGDRVVVKDGRVKKEST